MKILVTGSAGFIGFHLVNKLISEGYEVVGLDSINDYYDPKLKYDRLEDSGISKELICYGKYIKSFKYEKYKFIKLDIEDDVNLNNVFYDNNFDYVCHLAAQAGVRYSIDNPRIYIQSNIVGFFNILECCRNFRIKHLMYASSSSVYGNNSNIPFKETDNVDNPISLYAATKKSNELMAHTYSHLYYIPTTGLRFFTVYGPWGRPDMAYFSFAEKIMSNEIIKVYNHGNLSRDFTYIDDIINGIFLIISKEKSKESLYDIYNLGNSGPINLLEFIRTLEKALGLVAIKEFVQMQLGDVSTTYADVSKLSELGYQPKVSLGEGIDKFVEWFENYN
jgi:UDP-glucuronate 4-epimerase